MITEDRKKPPKKWTSFRVCPACGNRATKIFNFTSGLYRCQVCEHEYAPPSGKGTKDGLGWLRFISS